MKPKKYMNCDKQYQVVIMRTSLKINLTLIASVLYIFV